MSKINSGDLDNMVETRAYFERKVPYDYQKLAIEDTIKGFETASRGQLIMACGSGKTLVSLWIYERLKPKYTLLLFPSLSLLRQFKEEWTINCANPFPYICVCSEKDIDHPDEIHIDLLELGGVVTTNPDTIRQFLEIGPLLRKPRFWTI